MQEVSTWLESHLARVAEEEAAPVLPKRGRAADAPDQRGMQLLRRRQPAVQGVTLDVMQAVDTVQQEAARAQRAATRSARRNARAAGGGGQVAEHARAPRRGTPLAGEGDGHQQGVDEEGAAAGAAGAPMEVDEGEAAADEEEGEDGMALVNLLAQRCQRVRPAPELGMPL